MNSPVFVGKSTNSPVFKATEGITVEEVGNFPVFGWGVSVVNQNKKKRQNDKKPTSFKKKPVEG